MIKTMRISLVLAAVVSLFGNAAQADILSAENVTQAEIDRFVAVVVLQGCKIDGGNAAIVEQQLNYSELKLRNIANMLIEKGQIVPFEIGDGFTLINKDCQ